jgi:hypothetical protein
VNGSEGWIWDFSVCSKTREADVSRQDCKGAVSCRDQPVTPPSNMKGLSLCLVLDRYALALRDNLWHFSRNGDKGNENYQTAWWLMEAGNHDDAGLYATGALVFSPYVRISELRANLLQGVPL